MSRLTQPSHPLAVVLALLVTFLWSTSWILVRWGLDDEALPPITFAALRYGTASLILLSVLAARPANRQAVQRIERSELRVIAGLGVILYAVTQGAQFVAIDRQPAATTSLILSATPLLVALIAGRARVEPPTRQQVIGAILVMTGAATFFSGDLGATTVGMVAACTGLLANSAGAFLGRQANRHHSTPAIVVTALSMTLGAILLAAAGLTLDGWPTVTGRAWLIIVWLALVNTALAFTLWNLSLRRLSAFESAGINNTMLLQIAVLAWWLLDESPGAAGLVGIVLVTAGVVLTQLRRTVPARV